MRSIGYIACLLLAVTAASAEIRNKGWWNSTVFYQIYPRSFQDSDGNGVGDLKGITSKLQHFKDSGIGAIWLSPINKSPMVDFGYDISDFRDIDPTFGTLGDFQDLIKKAKELGLKVILDLVPNHTSDKHLWFELSVNSIGKYKDYYVWHNGKKETAPNGTVITVAPNNWKSVFNGSGWTWHETRKQYYFHQFYSQQPDLNYENSDVQQEMKDVMKFWLDIGVDGFRIDAVPHLFESNITQDEPPSNITGVHPDDHLAVVHTLTKDQPKTYTLIQSWRDFVDQYSKDKDIDEKVLMTEAYTSWDNTVNYYNYGSHVPFNFKFITDANAKSSANDFKNLIDKWIAMMPPGKVANWVMGNHDRVRLATRYPGKADQMTMLAMVLPGVAVTYYGEEIGMEDNSTLKIFDFRDGCRTPFQWNDSLSAGFSTNTTTWLPVHNNYRELNLAKQKQNATSHYKLYTTLTALRKSQTLKEGSLTTSVKNNDVLVVARRSAKETIMLLVNFKSEAVTVNVSDVAIGDKTTIVASDVNTNLVANTTVSPSNLSIPPDASVILRTGMDSGASMATYSIIPILLVMLISLFRS